MAVTDNQRRRMVPGLHRTSVKLEAGDRAYGNTMLYRDANGHGVIAPVATKRAAGVVVEEADNTGLADEATLAEVYEDGKFLFTFSGTALTEAHNGVHAFGVDNDVLKIDVVAGDLPLGVVTKVVSSTKAWIMLDPYRVIDTDT